MQKEEEEKRKRKGKRKNNQPTMEFFEKLGSIGGIMTIHIHTQTTKNF